MYKNQIEVCRWNIKNDLSNENSDFHATWGETKRWVFFAYELENKNIALSLLNHHSISIFDTFVH